MIFRTFDHNAMAARILCIDDEASGLYFRKLLLEKQGYAVETATSPAEALNKFQSNDFDLVVTDHLLGRSTGTELARELKRLKSDVRIIILSGTVDIPGGAEIADGFVSKTDGPEALFQKISELLSQSAAASRPAAQTLQAAPLQNLLAAAIVESSDDAIFSKSLDGTILTWNKAAQRMYGYTAEEIIGQPVSVLMPPDLRDQFREIMSSIRRGEMVDHLVTRRLAKDGRELMVVITVFPVRDQQGHILSAATIARDVTQMKAAENALRNSERLATAGRMAATVAHEINNPLEAVTNILFLLNQVPSLDPTAHEFVHSAQQEIARIRQIAQLTLKYHRQSAAEVEQVRLPELVDGIVTLYGRRLSTLGIDIEKRYEGTGTVEGYSGELRQVISNLIVNAMDALEQKGTKLRVRICDRVDRLGKPGVRVIIADNAGGHCKAAPAPCFRPLLQHKRRERHGRRPLGLEGHRRKAQRHDFSEKQHRTRTVWHRLLDSSAAAFCKEFDSRLTPPIFSFSSPPSAHPQREWNLLHRTV